MAHPRTLIRQAVAALLVGASTNAGARVTDTRVEPHRKTQLPAIAIYTLHDPVDIDESKATAPIVNTHNLQLEIACWVAHSDSYPAATAMDDLAGQVQAAMASDYYLGSTVVEQQLIGTEMQLVEDDGRSDPMVGIAVLTYEVVYRESPVEVGGNVQPFVTAGVTTKPPGGVSDTAPLTDAFTEAQ